jgi:hypothetical protein
VNKAADRAAVSAIDEKLSALARRSAGPSATAYAVSTLTSRPATVMTI